MSAFARRNDRVENPTLSVCIPQYNRTPFLLRALESLDRQTFSSFEVCISDDCSTDGGQQVILDYLERSSLSYVFRRNDENLRYDGNLRSSLSLARGEFAFLLGNDDGLAGPDILQRVADGIAEVPGPIAVAVTNYADAATGRPYRRVRAKGLRTGDAFLAAVSYRNFAFLSGLVLHRQRAQELSSEDWDGVEFYQTYLACRMLAEGGRLLNLDLCAVQMGLQVPGEDVDSYARRERLDPCPIVERRLNLDGIGRLVVAAIDPYIPPLARSSLITLVMTQLYLLTYPFWIVEYRRVQSRSFAVGVCLGMRPRNSLAGMRLATAAKAGLTCLYGVVSLAGLTVPIGAFDRARPMLYRLSKAATAVGR